MTGAVATPRRFVLLDRDGTINEEVGYLDHPDDLTLIHGSAVAIRGLREQGLGIVVVTKDDEPLISPISEHALRNEAEFDQR